MTHRVLILCTGNCVRSQMAEGLLRHLGDAAYEVHSAGSKPNGYVSPLAIEAMREIGLDISAHRSKSVSEFEGQRFDTVITVCDSAAEQCPVFPGSPQRIHWSIWDPGAATGSHDEKLAAFRRVRDDLASRLRSFLAPA
ncbi:MAG TPA: arsenate reductase ArsC [Candidatus Acidoferrum sp.]|nr:arsenate reductase ArsC [Candidatus Acidoferrum sp.]